MADDAPNARMRKFIEARAESVLRYETLVDERISKLDYLDTIEDEAIVTREAAILAALSTRLLAERQHLVAAELTVLRWNDRRHDRRRDGAQPHRREHERLAYWTMWLVRFDVTAHAGDGWRASSSNG